MTDQDRQGGPGPTTGADAVGRLAIGARVVVRHRLAEPDATTGATLTDVVGELLSRTAATVVVDTRDGPVMVLVETVTAAKAVPPRPVRRGPSHLAVSVDDLTRIRAETWPALEAANLGDWELRASGGVTHRASAVVTIGSPGVPLTEAVDIAESWYAARGLTPDFTVALAPRVELNDHPLGGELLARGYRVATSALALTASVDAVLAATPSISIDGGLGSTFSMSADLAEDWLSSFVAQRDVDATVARAILVGTVGRQFASVHSGGALVGRARMGSTRGWASVASVHVTPVHRREGMASRMMADLMRAVQAEGIRLVCLEVETGNDPARRLYEGLGFDTHHAYANLQPQ